MPFIEQIRRIFVDKTGTWEKVGELCYMIYRPFVKRWRDKRRWTTAHNITKEHFKLTDEQTAGLMAWFVFMHKEVMPYEDEKEAENGRIDG